MKLPTGAIDQAFNLIHKLCGIVLMVLAIAFGTSAYFRIFGTGGTSDKIEKTLLHVDQSAGATQRLIQEEHDQQIALYGKLGKTLDSADGTIRQANTTITKLGTAIDSVKTDLASTSGAVNGTLGEVKSTMAQVRTDLGTANTAIAGIRPVLDQAHDDLADLDALIKDPSIQQSLQGIAGSSANVERITASTAHIASTVDVQVTKLAHPTKAQQAVSWILTVLRGASYTSWLFK